MKPFHTKCEMLSKECAVLLGFMIPISTTGTHIVLFLLMMSWFLSGNLQEKVKFIIQHPVARMAFLLFGVFLIGTTYSTASIEHMQSLLNKMSKLLYLPFLLPLMTEKKWRERALWAFIAAMLFTFVLSLFKVYGGLPISPKQTFACIFKDHIYTNLMMAVASFMIGHTAMNLPKSGLRTALFGVLASLTFYIFFMSEGRSGYIIFILLWLLLGLQRYRIRGLWLGILGLSVVLALAFTSSERFQQRVSLGVQNVVQYWDGNNTSSLGARLEYIKHTFQLSAQHPWLGFGTGSFKEIYQAHAEDFDTPTTGNPHNEYLNIFLQLGAMGLLAFLGFFWVIFKKSFSLPKPEGWFAQGLLLAWLAGCFANSWLMDFTAGYFFIALLAFCFGALKLKEVEEHE